MKFKTSHVIAIAILLLILYLLMSPQSGAKMSPATKNKKKEQENKKKKEQENKKKDMEMKMKNMERNMKDMEMKNRKDRKTWNDFFPGALPKK